MIECLGMVADSALQLGRLAEAMAAAREGVDLVRTSGMWGALIYVLGPFAEATAWG
jgi:hypothetical protein